MEGNCTDCYKESHWCWNRSWNYRTGEVLESEVKKRSLAADKIPERSQEHEQGTRENELPQLRPAKFRKIAPR